MLNIVMFIGMKYINSTMKLFKSRKTKERGRQQSFAGEGFARPNDCFGGSLLKNSNAKTKRPLDSKFPLHLVLRARQNCLRQPKVFARVNEIVERTAEKHGITVYKYANVGDHIHLLLRLLHKRNWNAFIRELTGRVAQLVGESGKAFWLYRPFTRLVRGWQQAFRIAKDYVSLNQLEAAGLVSRQQIKTLKDLRLVCAVG